MRPFFNPHSPARRLLNSACQGCYRSAFCWCGRGPLKRRLLCSSQLAGAPYQSHPIRAQPNNQSHASRGAANKPSVCHQLQRPLCLAASRTRSPPPRQRWTSLVRLSALPCRSQASGAQAFYLPGVAPKEYQDGDRVDIRVHKLSSPKTHLPYDYYSLPFCEPAEGKIRVAENLGEVLHGAVIQNSPYEILMGKSEFKVCCQADTEAPRPPYCTNGVRVPASCVPYVPEAQGGLPPGGRQHCRCRAVPASGVPPHRLPWHPRCAAVASSTARRRPTW